MTGVRERAMLDEREAGDPFIWIEDTDLYSYFVITKQNYTSNANSGFLLEFNPHVVYQGEDNRRVEATFRGAGRRARRIIRGAQAATSREPSPLPSKAPGTPKQTSKHSNFLSRREKSQPKVKGSPNLSRGLEIESEAELIIPLHGSASDLGENDQLYPDPPGVNIDTLEELESQASGSQHSFIVEERYFTQVERFCDICGEHGHTYRYCFASIANQCLNCLGNHFKSQCTSIVCRRCHELGHIDKECPIHFNRIKSVKCPLCGMFGHLKDCRTLNDYEEHYQNFEIKDLRCLECGQFGHLICKK
jgi:hypothetical protein